jgi:outer membrane protein OmpA-like peptidoglycan-associated protein
MKQIIFFSAIALALTGCSLTPQKAPICSGNLLRGCQPVVYFDLNSTKLSAETKHNLNWAMAKMKRWPSKHIKLTGHADWHGEPDKNLNLSKKRAQAVKNYLVKNGINADRITVEFKGEINPVCHTASCQHLNRRVESNIYAPYGGWAITNK